jgi:hypothetical protein
MWIMMGIETAASPAQKKAQVTKPKARGKVVVLLNIGCRSIPISDFQIGTFEKPLPHAAPGAKSDTGQQGGF